MFDYLSTLFSEPIAFFDQAIFRTLAVLIGLCCHEWGHAYVAYRCGDDTAKHHPDVLCGVRLRQARAGQPV